jgi:hypothetical protein
VTSARAVGVGAWAERAAERADLGDHATRLTVLGAASFGASNVRGAHDLAAEYGHRALRDGLCVDAPAGVLAAAAMAVVDMNFGEIDKAIAGLRAAITALTELGDTYGAVTLQAIVPIFLGIAGDFLSAIAESAVATRGARALGNPTALVTALFAEGLAHVEDDPTHALAAFEESLALTDAGASDIVFGEIQEQLIRLRILLGDLAGAVAAAHTGFDYAVEVGNRLTSVTVLWYALEALVPLGAVELAGTLFGLVDDAPEIAPMLSVFVGPQSIRHAELREQVRAALGDQRFAEFAARGAAMSYDDAVTYFRPELAHLVEHSAPN